MNSWKNSGASRIIELKRCCSIPNAEVLHIISYYIYVENRVLKKCWLNRKTGREKCCLWTVNIICFCIHDTNRFQVETLMPLKKWIKYYVRQYTGAVHFTNEFYQIISYEVADSSFAMRFSLKLDKMRNDLYKKIPKNHSTPFSCLYINYFYSRKIYNEYNGCSSKIVIPQNWFT